MYFIAPTNDVLNKLISSPETRKMSTLPQITRKLQVIAMLQGAFISQHTLLSKKFVHVHCNTSVELPNLHFLLFFFSFFVFSRAGK